MLIRAGNLSPHRYQGWLRTVVSEHLPWTAGKTEGGVRWVAAGRLGEGLQAVDVAVDLAPGEEIEIRGPGEKAEWTTGPLPAGLMDWFGGVPCIEGMPMAWVAGGPDGAGYSAQFRCRTGGLLVVELWVRWYPDTPAMAVGEVIVAASNPAVPQVLVTLPVDLNLTWGSADVLTGQPDGRLMRAGDHIADGQARTVPFSMVWRNRMRGQADWDSAAAAMGAGVAAYGLGEKLYHYGSPLVVQADIGNIAGRQYTDALGALHGWEGGPLGVAASSGQTGAQEDQLFPGVECTQPRGVAAVSARYLTACRQSLRPCHHLEADGTHLRLAEHPQLVLWDGRPHWHTGVSPDRLGKTRTPSDWELHRWWGPDVEHALCQTLTASARMTGSPALQWQLEHWARIYPRQWTIEPGYSTSAPYAARAVGYEGILAVNLWSTLRDRELAESVRAHWLARADRILVPQLGTRWNDLWDVRQDDPRLGPGPWWICWQQSLGTYGLDLAGEVFRHADARIIARRGASRVMLDAWKLVDGRWKSRAQMSAVDSNTGTLDESFNGYGMPCAVAVTLRHDPEHEQARSIWAQLIRDNQGAGKWLAPATV